MSKTTSTAAEPSEPVPETTEQPEPTSAPETPEQAPEVTDVPETVESVPVPEQDATPTVSEPVSAYQEAVRSGVDSQAATHLATVPTIATAVTADGIHRIIDVNVDPAWKPAQVESDPAERERLIKAQDALEAKLEGNTTLLAR
jgi:hypothetical protein